MTNDTIEVDKFENSSNQSTDTQKKTQKKGKKQMAELQTIAVEPPIEEKKPLQATQKSQKNEKNNKKKNLLKPNELADANSAPVAVVATETQDTAPTGTSKSKKQKSKKEKKAAAAKQQQQQQQPTENDKNSLNTEQQSTPPLQANAVKVANEKIVTNCSKKNSVKPAVHITAADSNKVSNINQCLPHIVFISDFTYLFILFNFWFHIRFLFVPLHFFFVVVSWVSDNFSFWLYSNFVGALLEVVWFIQEFLVGFFIRKVPSNFEPTWNSIRFEQSIKSKWMCWEAIGPPNRMNMKIREHSSEIGWWSYDIFLVCHINDTFFVTHTFYV